MSTASFGKRQRGGWPFAAVLGLLALTHTQTLLAAPFITQQPQPQLNVSTDTPAFFSVTAVNDPQAGPIGYQWKKNGVIIPNATDSSFFINNVQITNGGSASFTLCPLATGPDISMS